MSLNFGNSKVTQVKFGANTSSLSDVNKIIFNGSVAWCRPFTLTITKDSKEYKCDVDFDTKEVTVCSRNVGGDSYGPVHDATEYWSDIDRPKALSNNSPGTSIFNLCNNKSNLSLKAGIPLPLNHLDKLLLNSLSSIFSFLYKLFKI